jgi:hypothetical protein
MYPITIYHPRGPWNKNKLVGQKRPLKLQQNWAIRIRSELFNKVRDLALFNLAIDSKLRSCDLVALKVNDIWHGNSIQSRAIIVQKKPGTPVDFPDIIGKLSTQIQLDFEQQSVKPPSDSLHFLWVILSSL